jgi:plastocyanin
MTTPLRLALFACAGLGSLLGLAAFAANDAEAAPQEGAESEWAALVHDVLVFEPDDEQAAYASTVEWIAHVRAAHPAARIRTYSQWVGPRREVHVLFETVNTLAYFVLLDEIAKCEPCQELDAEIEALTSQETRRRSRLIASDPGSERRLGSQAALIVRSLRANYASVGSATDAAERLVQHVNATYPEIYARAYDEWYPRSGRIQFHFYMNWIPAWEEVERRMRQDPLVREIMEGGQDAFVSDSFEDTWLINLAP